MKYKTLKSIVASQKDPTTLQSSSDSFFVKSKRVAPYIEPDFSKIEFPKEKPSILLVSAIGASGKTTAAHALSFDIQLPILDLAQHKAVGDNTLTGILTTAYPIDQVGAVLEGLQKGTHGIIIDGIDEGRSKTTEQGFEAFLDDLIQRSKGSTSTAIVVFGRSQILLSTWFYLEDSGADVGMVQIDQFTLEQAKEYIDSSVTGASVGRQEYKQARDEVLAKLSDAFSPSTPKDKQDEDVFLSFIGYPPVLDAIATLLRKERNYHRIQQTLSGGKEDRLKTGLLICISDYLLDREHKEKALPNFIEQIADTVGGPQGQILRKSLYDREEQCARILSRALNRPFSRQVIEDNALNEQYESTAGEWCKEHPFLDDERVRNVVFAAFAVTRCALSTVREYRDLAHDYAVANRPTYHLLYILAEFAKSRDIDARCFNMLIQSCSEFMGINADILIDIDGSSWEESDGEQDTGAELTIAIEFPEKHQSHTFMLKGTIGAEPILLGPYLVNTSATLPCEVDLSGTPALETIGNCSISARRVHINTPDLILRNISRKKPKDAQGNSALFINTHEAKGHAKACSVGTGKIEIQCVEHTLGYPLAKYVRKVAAPLGDSMIKEKYRRLRRIFSEFASHKRGGLAKYRRKIEHERVLRNPLGRQILDALIRDGILRKEQNFYHVVQEQFAAKLGITWQQLRQYESSSKLEEFLNGVL